MEISWVVMVGGIGLVVLGLVVWGIVAYLKRH